MSPRTVQIKRDSSSTNCVKQSIEQDTSSENLMNRNPWFILSSVGLLPSRRLLCKCEIAEKNEPDWAWPERLASWLPKAFLV